MGEDYVLRRKEKGRFTCVLSPVADGGRTADDAFCLHQLKRREEQGFGELDLGREMWERGEGIRENRFESRDS
uniref:Uncharacterized protein n=1 Tax=Nelumbo nucifera TaxID=4432 RepID=A0A822ZP05_NELNU|nr:TPA_asm: hypothetical protein HUJ06_016470 [Nelumbo nucifera]